LTVQEQCVYGLKPLKAQEFLTGCPPEKAGRRAKTLVEINRSMTVVLGGGTSTIGRELFAGSFPPTIMTSTFISPAKNDVHLRIQIDDDDQPSPSASAKAMADRRLWLARDDSDVETIA
jgi:hypothetical protein